MRYAATACVLAVAAALATSCQQKEPPRQAPEPRVRWESQGNSGPLDGPEPQAGDEPNKSGEAQADDKSPAHDPPDADQGDNTDEEPLLLLEDAPLLLDDGRQEPSGPVADNSRCYHCHLNYMDEELAVVHARALIGCADCHGNCDEHIADESWASGGNGTPPEIMYPREKINPFCLECHPKDEIDELEHKGLFAGTSKEEYCTDCHGDHRLAERKCKWR